MKTKFKLFLEGRFPYLGDKLILAGRSKYPVGTKIKFKDEGRELTGTLTHPFGCFGNYGDVGVYIDQKGIFTNDQCNLKNNEYKVIDPEAEIEPFKKDIEKFGI